MLVQTSANMAVCDDRDTNQQLQESSHKILTWTIIISEGGGAPKKKYLNAFFGASHVKSIKSRRMFNVPMAATSKVKSQDGSDKVQNRWMKK